MQLSGLGASHIHYQQLYLRHLHLFYFFILNQLRQNGKKFVDSYIIISTLSVIRENQLEQFLV